MDTQDSSLIDVPNLKLAKVGKDRDRKRGGGSWLGARSASSGFSGAVGGAGAGASGFMGTGMSLAKLLAVLLISGGVSVGAWQMGNRIAANSVVSKPAAPKLFADKDSGKYADTSGVVKSEKSIPNSLGYINNDGLTDEQRAAKKAAEEAASAKAAADAQAKADADAKKKALDDATAASAAPAPAAPAEVAKKGLTGGKFGGMNSSLGGGGGGLSGGAGLSGGINGKFAGMGGLGGKGQSGAMSAFRSPSRASSSASGAAGHSHSNSKGFAKQQLDNANGLSRQALASGQTESAAAGAGAPFDNNAQQGSVISGPGLGSGTQAGSADSGATSNPSGGGGGSGGSAIGTAACPNANYEPDANGNCVNQTATPTAVNAAPYQGLIDAAMILLGLIIILSLIASALGKTGWTYAAGMAVAIAVAVMGAAVAAIGVAIAAMKHGDFMIGAIIGMVGGYVAYTACSSMGNATKSGWFVAGVPHLLIAAAVGELAAGSTKAGGMM